MIKHNASWLCVLMEVATGEIKVIMNLKEILKSMLKTSTYTEATIGSTFKMASMLAALDDGFIEPRTRFLLVERKYGPQRMVDAHPPHFPNCRYNKRLKLLRTLEFLQ